jgi:hypothetical protein
MLAATNLKEGSMRKKSISAIGLSILGGLLVVLIVVTVAAGFEIEAPNLPIPWK